MGDEESEVAEEVAERLSGKKVIKWMDAAQSASEATEMVNQELALEIRNPDNFSELRDSIEEAILEYLDSKDSISLV